MKTTNKKIKAPHPLNDIERAAVVGAMGSKDSIDEIKKAIAPGIYQGQVVLKVVFTVSKAESTDCDPTCDLLSLAVFAKALVLSGIQRENFYAALKTAALQAYSADKKVGDQMEENDKRVVEEIEKLKKEVISQLPRGAKSGSTKVVAQVAKVTLVQSGQQLTEAIQNQFAVANQAQG